MIETFRTPLIMSLLLAPLPVLRAEVPEVLPTVVSLDTDWKFKIGANPAATNPAYDDSAWQRVDVPHDYVIPPTKPTAAPPSTASPKPSCRRPGLAARSP